MPTTVRRSAQSTQHPWNSVAASAELRHRLQALSCRCPRRCRRHPPRHLRLRRMSCRPVFRCLGARCSRSCGAALPARLRLKRREHQQAAVEQRFSGDRGGSAWCRSKVPHKAMVDYQVDVHHGDQ
eukprot:4441-Chlamydomonas_euryale.AAC.3